VSRVSGTSTSEVPCYPCCPCFFPEADSFHSATPAVGIPVAAAAPLALLPGAVPALYESLAVVLAPDAPEAVQLASDCPGEASSRAGCQEEARDAHSVEERTAAGPLVWLALPAWCADFQDASARAAQPVDFRAAAPVAPAVAPVELTAGAGPAAHCSPDARLQDCFPELPDGHCCFPELLGAGPLGLAAEEHFPEHPAAVRAADEHCYFQQLQAWVQTHPDAEHCYFRAFPDVEWAPLPGCFPAAPGAQHFPVHWPIHALRYFRPALAVQHSLVHCPFLGLCRALLAAGVAPA